MKQVGAPNRHRLPKAAFYVVVRKNGFHDKCILASRRVSMSDSIGYVRRDEPED